MSRWLNSCVGLPSRVDDQAWRSCCGRGERLRDAADRERRWRHRLPGANGFPGGRRHRDGAPPLRRECTTAMRRSRRSGDTPSHGGAVRRSGRDNALAFAASAVAAARSRR